MGYAARDVCYRCMLHIDAHITASGRICVAMDNILKMDGRLIKEE